MLLLSRLLLSTARIGNGRLLLSAARCFMNFMQPQLSPRCWGHPRRRLPTMRLRRHMNFMDRLRRHMRLREMLLRLRRHMNFLATHRKRTLLRCRLTSWDSHDGELAR